MRLFLRLLLIDSLFGCALAAGALVCPPIHIVALVAIVCVLAAFAAGTGTLLWISHERRKPHLKARLMEDVAELAEKLPGLALIGTAAGFLVALSGDSAGIQHRISGASTGITSTIVGVACWLVLSAQHRMLDRETA